MATWTTDLERLAWSVLGWVGLWAFCGCGRGSDRAVNSGQDSREVIAVAASEPSVPEPVPFESLAISSDSSYESPKVSAGAQAGEVREFTKLKLKFCWCSPGQFTMGSPSDSPNHFANETQHVVTLSKGFWIQQTELTQSHYEQLMGTNPAFFKGSQNPVESINWSEATEFCQRLSMLPPERTAGNLFRLPTEAQWEYACRTGTTTVFCFGDDAAGLDEHGWYYDNSENKTHPVGKKKSNAWNIHDMHGNVSEWCQDFYGDYSVPATTDPLGPKSGEKRILRGGGWFQVPMWARSSHRDAYPATTRYVGLGFRLIATAAEHPESPERE